MSEIEVVSGGASPPVEGSSSPCFPSKGMVKVRGRMNEVVGEVTSDKMDKTISVLIYRLVKHKRYGKFIRRTSVFKAHDECNTAKVGDRVKIYEVRPMSRTKRWKLREIVRRAEKGTSI